MQNKRIILTLLALLVLAPVMAKAGTAPASTQQAATPPANMSDEALASYISGRLAPLLKESTYQVSQNCDDSGCSVVVQ